MDKRLRTLTQWFITHERHLIGSFVMIMAICASFLFGMYNGQAAAHSSPIIAHVSGNGVMPKTTCQEDQRVPTTLKASDCQFVGSAKGTKYYPPTCSYAQKIAKENLRCFVSAESAEQQGYTRSTSCK